MDSIQIPIWRWISLLRSLRCASAGRRESGAFLLAKQGDRRVVQYVMYNSLDPNVADTGVITFRGGCIATLWKICQQKELRVISDVHTHPGISTVQSLSDQMHPMIGQAGHIAMIVPNFASSWLAGLGGVGIHEYLGNRCWKHWPEHSGRVRLVML